MNALIISKKSIENKNYWRFSARKCSGWLNAENSEKLILEFDHSV